MNSRNDDHGPYGVDHGRRWLQEAHNHYKLSINQELELPSRTVEWLPDFHVPPDKNYAEQTLILGTSSDPSQSNLLYTIRVQLPLINLSDDDCNGKGKRKVTGGGDEAVGGSQQHGGIGRYVYENKADTIQLIHHNGHVNRARYMPQKHCIIATKSDGDEVYLFDTTQYPSVPASGGACCPGLRLKGHTAGGFALSWSRLNPGYLLSGSYDCKICLWDVKQVNGPLDALQTFEVHEVTVEDVAWHQKHWYLFGSVGGDYKLNIWDLRSVTVAKPSATVAAHREEVNCLSFNPFNEWVVLTGSGDKTVKIFDIRRLSTAIQTFESHTAEVCNVDWSPKRETVFASSGLDNRLMLWDTSRTGKVQAPEDSLDGPPELLFVHCGHSAPISDFSWNPCENWVLASVGEDNMVQFWKMEKHFYQDSKHCPKRRWLI